MVQAVSDTVTEEQQSPSQNKGGFGWGVVMASVAVATAVFAAVGGFELFEHKSLDLPDHGKVENLHGFMQGKNDVAQHLDKAGKVVDNIAGGLNDTLQNGMNGAKGAGGATVKGAEELYKTAFGIGSTDQARAILDRAVDVIDPASVNDNTIKAFLQSGAESARYDKDYWLIKVDGDVLKINEKEFLAIDPRVGGGANLMPSSRTFDGMHPETIEEIQKAMLKAKAPDIGDAVTPKMAVGIGAGLFAKSVFEHKDAVENIMPTNRANPTARIDPKDAHLVRMAVNSPALNQAFASMT